jgi:hypothetical protein
MALGQIITLMKNASVCDERERPELAIMMQM